MENHFSNKMMNTLYADVRMVKLWEDTYQDKPLTMNLWFHGGQRKEGCLSLSPDVEDEALYQIMFWFAKNKADGKEAIYIGALQGPQNGNDLIKGLTKHSSAIERKNLIFMVCVVLRKL